jgi:superoxide dismutase, Cu-Zn family
MKPRPSHLVAALAVSILSIYALQAQDMGGHGHAHDHGAGTGADAAQHAQMFASINRAVAVLRPTEGSNVLGIVLFEQQGDSVKVTADVRGLPPNSTHGFHVHEYGDATSADGSSAGSHYNPDKTPHGIPGQSDHMHAGDLGNLKTDASGTAHYEATFNTFSIAGMKNPIIGRGVVVHEKADDGGQPTGNAGGRVGVGVIGVAAPPKQ